MSFVRTSKYRNVFGQACKRDEIHDNFRISSSSDILPLKANTIYISAIVDVSGGGAFAVLKQSEKGRVPDKQPRFIGHSGPVIDCDFHPFISNIVVSGSDDSTIKLWTIPNEFKTEISSATATLTGHGKKITQVLFHPTAENVLMSSSLDYLIKIWDVEKLTDKITLENHEEPLGSVCWSSKGDMIASTCRDRQMRLFDVRSSKLIAEKNCHEGAKAARVVFATDEDYLITSGFEKTSERQVRMWDRRNLETPISEVNLDRSASLSVPHFDRESNILYLSGRGDCYFSYYEFSEGQLHYINDYRSSDPQKAVTFIPRKGCNVEINEIAAAYRATSNYIERVSCIVPRRSVGFQKDIFPPAAGFKSSQTADEYFAGETKGPILCEMLELFSSASSIDLIDNKAPTFTPSKNESGAEVETVRKEYEEKISSKDAQIKEMADKIASLGQQIESLTTENQELLAKVSELAFSASKEE